MEDHGGYVKYNNAILWRLSVRWLLALGTSGMTVPILNAILAALAEQLAEEHDLECPRWTRAYGPLEEPWSPPSTPRMRAAFEESTPDAFRRRTLILSRSALFHSAR